MVSNWQYWQDLISNVRLKFKILFKKQTWPRDVYSDFKLYNE